MNISKVPFRMCIVTRVSLPKDSMFKIVKKDSQLLFDKAQKIEGRGYYIQKDADIIKKAQKNHILEKKTLTKKCDDLYLILLNELERK